MNSSSSTIIIILFIIILFFVIYNLYRQRKDVIMKKIITNKRKEENTQMIELAKKFINKECIVYSFNGNQIEGTVKEVSGSALMLENNGVLEAVNLDFIVRIREYPKKKNGKKKSVVLD